MKEKNIRTHYITKLIESDYGEVMDLPVSVLSSTTVDHYLSSYTKGPLQVYPLWTKSESGVIYPKIWIGDGNHRYFIAKRNARFKFQDQYDEDRLFIEVEKVDPDEYPEFDIRIMFEGTVDECNFCKRLFTR